MVKYEIRRTYLVRKTQVFIADMPDDMDPDHLIEEHAEEFDVDLCGGGDPLNGWTAEQVTIGEEEPDEQIITLAITERRPANVIRMSDRKRKT